MLLKKRRARNTANKLELQKNGAKQYKAMDSAKKQNLLSKQAEKFKTMDPEKKAEWLQKGKQKYCGSAVEIRVKKWIHALKQHDLKRK